MDVREGKGRDCVPGGDIIVVLSFLPQLKHSNGR